VPAVGESHRSGFHRVGIYGVAMFNDFKDNRTYALAWVLTLVTLTFAVAVNVEVQNMGKTRGVSVPEKSGNLSSSR
jgi:hypothetical protein